MIKCGKFLTIKKEESANQSEGCDARRKARYGPSAALCSVQPSSTMRKCASAPKGQSVRGYGEVYGSSFSGNHDRLALEKRQTKA